MYSCRSFLCLPIVLLVICELLILLPYILTVALVRQFGKVRAHTSLANYSLVAIISTAYFILHIKTTLIDSYMVYAQPHKEASQTPFVLPSCLEAHATPSYENGDRAPCYTPSTRHHPLTPATAPGSPAVRCSEYTHADETQQDFFRNKATLDSYLVC